MSGTISSTMMIAANGFLKNQGLAVSTALTSALTSFDTSPLTVVYANLRSDGNLMANLSVTLPSWITGDVGAPTGNVSANIRALANGIAPDTKKFLAVLQMASGFVSTSVAWGATATDAGTKSFGDFGLGVKSASDLASGGLGNVFKAADGSAPNFPQLGNIVIGFGTAYDPSTLSTMFTPVGFITGLQKQGLGNVGGLNTKLVAAGADPTDLTSVDPTVLTQVLSTVTGAEAAKVVTQTKIAVPNGSSITSLADFLDARKVVYVDQVNKLPGGSLAGLGNALTNMGGNFKTCTELGQHLASIKIASFSNLDSLSSPIPASIAGDFKPRLGTGSSAAGTPTINDLLGTAAGYVHTGSFTSLVTNQAKILGTSSGQALLTAAQALDSDHTNLGYIAAFEAAQNAVTGSSDPVITKAISDSNAALTASVSHIQTEINNLNIAGIAVPATTTPGATQLLGLASKLHDYGVDKQSMGFNTMLNNMATNDVYGDAVRASLLEGQNIAASSAAGIVNTTKLDPAQSLTKLQNQ